MVAMFIPNELMRWGDWKNEVCCMCSVLAPVDSLSLQKFSKEIVANVCKTCGNVASTFHWTFAWFLFPHTLTTQWHCWLTFRVFLLVFYWQGSCGLYPNGYDKKKIIAGFFRTPCPPPPLVERDDQSQGFGTPLYYWERISHGVLVTVTIISRLETMHTISQNISNIINISIVR